MRVIAGEWRGRKLGEPRGRDVTRPTTDRVREACASMVHSALAGGIEGSAVLDAFAGSGALGIEMLSRGASRCTFFDIDRSAAGLVARNLETVGCGRERFCTVTGDVLVSASRGRVPGAPFDLVLLDPPYALDAGIVGGLLEHLSASGCLAPACLALYEHAAAAPDADPAGFSTVRSKRYGITAVQLLRLEEANNDD